MGLSEIGWEGLDFIHLSKDRSRRRAVTKAVMSFGDL